MEFAPLLAAGLTRGEAKVYRALLRTGASTTGPLVAEAKVSRSKIYEILERLSEKGLVSRALKNNTKTFSPTKPSRFIDFLKRKEQEIQNQTKEMQKVLPQLEDEYQKKNITQEAEVFVGLEGLRHAREKYLSELKKGETIYFLGVPESAYEHLEAYYEEWNNRRIKKGIISYTLFTPNAREHPYVKEKKKQKHTFIKFFPPLTQSHAWTEIYPQAVVIATNYKKPMSIVVNNFYVAESYRQYFKLLWDIAKK